MFFDRLSTIWIIVVLLQLQIFIYGYCSKTMVSCVVNTRLLKPKICALYFNHQTIFVKAEGRVITLQNTRLFLRNTSAIYGHRVFIDTVLQFSIRNVCNSLKVPLYIIKVLQLILCTAVDVHRSDLWVTSDQTVPDSCELSLIFGIFSFQNRY